MAIQSVPVLRNSWRTGALTRWPEAETEEDATVLGGYVAHAERDVAARLTGDVGNSVGGANDL